MAETMFRRLRRYYGDNGILSTSFTCPHKKECGAGSQKFTGPKSAFVSTGYENESRDLPRLLFLSLDSGDGDKDDGNRLPEAVWRQEEVEREVLALPKHKHWYRTHELAWYIFKQFRHGIKIEEAKRHFAHANSAKCCMNKLERKKADKILFENCQKYLPGELEILRPDVVVTQGDEAREAVGSLYETLKCINEFASIISMNSRKVFWLHTYHPAAYGLFHKQRNLDKDRTLALGWEEYSRKIYEFMEARNKQGF